MSETTRDLSLFLRTFLHVVYLDRKMAPLGPVPSASPSLVDFKGLDKGFSVCFFSVTVLEYSKKKRYENTALFRVVRLSVVG